MDLEQKIEIFHRLCPCCGIDPESKPYSIFAATWSCRDLGEGYVVFFNLLVYFGLLGIFFYGINVYKVFVNINGSACIGRPPDQNQSDLQIYGQNQLPPCFNDWIVTPSRANFGIMQIDVWERSLIVAFLAIFWLAMAIFYHKIVLISRKIDETCDTPSDWTLMVPLVY